VDVLTPDTPAQWRAWLTENSLTSTEVWVVIPHRASGRPGMRVAEAMEQALCFGWIDSNARKTEPDSFELRFTPRRPQSRWSLVNQRRAADLTARGLMTAQGQAAIDRAKAAGLWGAPSQG
jgi:uncharacterized protein YdeI (YjbR/CyaY-like superfamily)